MSDRIRQDLENNGSPLFDARDERESNEKAKKKSNEKANKANLNIGWILAHGGGIGLFRPSGVTAKVTGSHGQSGMGCSKIK